MGEDGSNTDGSSAGRNRRRDSSVIPRRGVLAAGIALSSGCLRLSEENPDTGGTGNSTDTDDGSQNSGPTNPTQNNGPANSTEDSDPDTSERPSRVGVTGSTGQVDEDGEHIVFTSLVVRRGTEAGPIDLSEMTIQYVGPNTAETLVHASRGSPGFYLSPVIADQENDAVLTADSDRYRVSIPFESGDLGSVLAADDPVNGTQTVENTGLGPIGAGEQVELQLVTASGGSTSLLLAVPDTLADAAGDAVQL